MLGFSAIMALYAGAMVSVMPVNEIELTDNRLVLGQVVDLSALPAEIQSKFNDRVIAAFPIGQSPSSISSEIIKIWARRAVPLLKFEPAQGRSISVKLARAQKQKPMLNDGGKSACLAAATPIPSGTIISRHDTIDVTCRNSRAAGQIIFDRKAGFVRAANDISAGDYLGKIHLPNSKVLDGSAELVFFTQDGPVIVQRRVRALQVVQSGEQVFVATPEGTVFSTNYQAGDDKP